MLPGEQKGHGSDLGQYPFYICLTLFLTKILFSPFESLPKRTTYSMPPLLAYQNCAMHSRSDTLPLHQQPQPTVVRHLTEQEWGGHQPVRLVAPLLAICPSGVQCQSGRRQTHIRMEDHCHPLDMGFPLHPALTAIKLPRPSRPANPQCHRQVCPRHGHPQCKEDGVQTLGAAGRHGGPLLFTFPLVTRSGRFLHTRLNATLFHIFSALKVCCVLPPLLHYLVLQYSTPLTRVHHIHLTVQ
jgi:hypothetical protein